MQEKKTIALEDVSKAYSGNGEDFFALKAVSCAFSLGEFAAVVGKSGSGKSTLLNMIAGIDNPTDGKVYFDGKLITNMSEGKTAIWRGKNIGIVFQFFQLIPTLTVLENVLLPMDFCKAYPRQKRVSIAKELLAKTGVAEHANKLPLQLSGGEQQRAAVARALATDPSVLVADEPTGNLDSHTADEIVSLFRSLAASGKAVIMVTHSEELAGRTDRIITLRDGEIIRDERMVTAR